MAAFPEWLYGAAAYDARIPGVTVALSLDTTRWDTAMQEILLALAVRFTAVCPGCRRETHWLEYDLGAESCRACLEVIPRLQRTVRGARVDWAPISPELHWKRDRSCL
ncbi:MAG: hypothetical protein ACRDP6_14825 [Actinoallomurus sp.]